MQQTPSLSQKHGRALATVNIGALQVIWVMRKPLPVLCWAKHQVLFIRVWLLLVLKKIFWSQLQWLTFPNEGQQNCRHRDKHERPHLVERTLSLLLMWLCAKKKGRKEVGRAWRRKGSESGINHLKKLIRKRTGSDKAGLSWIREWRKSFKVSFFFLGHLFGRSVSNKGLLVRGALK